MKNLFIFTTVLLLILFQYHLGVLLIYLLRVYDNTYIINKHLSFQHNQFVIAYKILEFGLHTDQFGLHTGYRNSIYNHFGIAYRKSERAPCYKPEDFTRAYWRKQSS